MTHTKRGGSEPQSSTTSNFYLRLEQSQTIKSNLESISKLLNTGLSSESLHICVKLLELGVHPESLAEIVLQIKREIANLESNEETR